MLRLAAAVLVGLMASSVSAETATFHSLQGDIYIGELNDSGAVLRSKYPKAWFHGEPFEDHRADEIIVVIYLGKSCDALHPEYGAGTWGWWNDMFHIDFRQELIAFQNQELFDHGQFPDCQDKL
jgi:hypothetical protein